MYASRYIGNKMNVRMKLKPVEPLIKDILDRRIIIHRLFGIV